MSTDTQLVVRCSFCGKGQDEVKRLLAGPGAFDPGFFICDGCVGLCAAILDEGNAEPAVTVYGELERSALGGWLIAVDSPLVDFEEGETVEVTIAKPEQEAEEEHGLMCDCIDCVGAERIDWRP